MIEQAPPPTDEMIAWHDEQSRGSTLSERELLDEVKSELMKASTGNVGDNPAINRLIDAVAIMHDIMLRRLKSEQAEEHATAPAIVSPAE